MKYQIVSEWHRIQQFLVDDKGQEVVKNREWVLVDEIKCCERDYYTVQDAETTENLAEFKTFEEAKAYAEEMESRQND